VVNAQGARGRASGAGFPALRGHPGRATARTAWRVTVAPDAPPPVAPHSPSMRVPPVEGRWREVNSRAPPGARRPAPLRPDPVPRWNAPASRPSAPLLTRMEGGISSGSLDRVAERLLASQLRAPRQDSPPTLAGRPALAGAPMPRDETDRPLAVPALAGGIGLGTPRSVRPLSYVLLGRDAGPGRARVRLRIVGRFKRGRIEHEDNGQDRSSRSIGGY
jgi:hypothetical protein